jgi:hypothetical protein
MSKFYRRLTLVAIIACFRNYAEAGMIDQVLAIPKCEAGAKSGQRILGVEFGSPAAAASIKTVPITVSLKLADDGSDEIKVSPSEGSQAHLQDGAIAAIATTGREIARQTRADGLFTIRNDGPGIGAVARDRSRAPALQSPVEFIQVINDIHPQQMATVEHGPIPVKNGIQGPPRAVDASLLGAIVLDGEQASRRTRLYELQMPSMPL